MTTPDPIGEQHHRHASRVACSGGVLVAWLVLGLMVPVLLGGGIMRASAQDAERRPYDEKLLRLAEVLGAIHYLRALCDNGEGQAWRDRMTALIDAEGTSAARRAMLTQSFNRGFRTYSRSFRSCTQNAEATNKRFLAEAAEISAALLKTAP